MLPIAAHFARAATEELAQSALPRAPVRREIGSTGRVAAPPGARRRLAHALRRAADRLEPAPG